MPYSLYFGFFFERSPEEQQLQAVAESLAASVLHSSTSNPDLHARDVSHHEDTEDGDVRNNILNIQCREKTQVTYINIPYYLYFFPCNRLSPK